MRKIKSFLLIGTLGMFFAEIMAGSSQIWYINPFAYLLTFPLYLFHIIFLFNLAYRLKKTSLLHLYFFGIIFGLYESWITKVLWVGYIGQDTHTILGVGITEFPILVLFWHPIMSFILPILAYQFLTGYVISNHSKYLLQSRMRIIVIILYCITFSSFVANGNGFNLVSANLSLLGTGLLILLLKKLHKASRNKLPGIQTDSKNADINTIILKKRGFILTTIYLALLYIISFIYLLPERIPTSILPYITVFGAYIFAIFVITKSKASEYKLEMINNSKSFSKKQVGTLFGIVLLMTNLYCLLSFIGPAVLMVTYLAATIAGVVFVIKNTYSIMAIK